MQLAEAERKEREAKTPSSKTKKTVEDPYISDSPSADTSEDEQDGGAQDKDDGKPDVIKVEIFFSLQTSLAWLM